MNIMLSSEIGTNSAPNLIQETRKGGFQMETAVTPEKLEELIDSRVERLVKEKLEKLVDERLKSVEQKEVKNRIAIIASKGTLDMAVPPLLLATTAVAMDMEAGIFFTFYGMNILRKKTYQHLKVAPLANPAMPMPVPNLIGAIPGMTAMATIMMKGMMNKVKWPTIPEFLDMARESGVKLFACAPTMEILGIKPEELIDGVEVLGAAAYLEYAADAKITLFV